MLSPDDIQQLCARKYPAFLRAIIAGNQFFPLDIRFGRPSTTDEWQKLRGEISALANGEIGYRIDWTETNTRRWGRQKFPERVWFESEAEFLRAVRKTAEVEKLRNNLALTRLECPLLEPWLVGNASRLIESAAVWPELLKVCQYFLQNPRPGLYAREIPVDVDTKFIERHQAVLRSLLDFLLPEAARTDAERFEERFGLRFDEPSIRFRVLDQSLKTSLNLPCADLATPLSEFRQLNWNALRVFIVENKMTFLTFPSVAKAICIWGGGGAAEMLTSVDWLGRCELNYWGDIDVHGFHILAGLRSAFPKVQSLMMDEGTFITFRRSAVRAKAASYERLNNLLESECRMYALVRDEQLLLEQEKIPQSYICACIETVGRSQRFALLDVRAGATPAE